MSQERILKAKIGQQYPGLHKEEHCQCMQAGDPSSLCSTGEATTGVLGPVLGSSVQARHGLIWVSPGLGCKDD